MIPQSAKNWRNKFEVTVRKLKGCLLFSRTLLMKIIHCEYLILRYSRNLIPNCKSLKILNLIRRVINLLFITFFIFKVYIDNESIYK